mgnify:CR=1 FL=1
MRIFAVSGFSKTGKTTTIAAITKELTARGLSVGIIKDSRCEGLTLDTAGKDTYIHKQAGAQQVALRALNETDIMYTARLGLSSILEHFDQDVIILEGFAKYNLPKIVTGIIPFDLKARTTEKTFAYSGVIANTVDSCCGLPVINSQTDIGKLCDLILLKVPQGGKESLFEASAEVI